MQFQAALMGVNFRGKEIAALVAALPIGTQFTLERDPENQYDANAVKVIYSGEDEDQFVGFVAKEVAEEIAPLLDSGYEGSAKIIDFLGTIKPNLEIELTVPSGMSDDEESDDEDEESEEDAA